MASYSASLLRRHLKRMRDAHANDAPAPPPEISDQKRNENRPLLKHVRRVSSYKPFWAKNIKNRKRVYVSVMSVHRDRMQMYKDAFDKRDTLRTDIVAMEARLASLTLPKERTTLEAEIVVQRRAYKNLLIRKDEQFYYIEAIKFLNDLTVLRQTTDDRIREWKDVYSNVEGDNVTSIKECHNRMLIIQREYENNVHDISIKYFLQLSPESLETYESEYKIHKLECDRSAWNVSLKCMECIGKDSDDGDGVEGAVMEGGKDGKDGKVAVPSAPSSIEDLRCVTCKQPLLARPKSNGITTSYGADINASMTSVTSIRTISYEHMAHLVPDRKDTYKQINHLREYLRHIQGKSSVAVNEDVLAAIQGEITKNHLEINKLTPDHIRAWMKKLKLSKHYESCVAICEQLNPMFQPLYILPEHEEEFCSMFLQTLRPYHKIKKVVRKSRKSYMSYPFVAYKIAEIKGWTHYMPYFKLLKSFKLVAEQDRWWERVCSQLGWPFVPTIGNIHRPIDFSATPRNAKP